MAKLQWELVSKLTDTRAGSRVELEAALAATLVRAPRVDAVLELVAEMRALAALVYVCGMWRQVGNLG